MNDFPPELESRRSELFERVTKRGRMLRTRRFVVLVGALAIVVAVPVGAVALTAGGGRTPHHVTVSAPPTSADDSDSSTTSTTSTTVGYETTTTGPLALTSTTIGAPTPVTQPIYAPTTTTTALVCHNSTNPACGPFHYDPPLTNGPAVAVFDGVSPAHPTVGESVAFTLHVVDGDSHITAESPICGSVNYGDGMEQTAICDCAGPGPQYGPWDPPAPTPSDIRIPLAHTYKKAGDFTLTVSLTAGQCSERPSPATASYTVHIAP